MGDPIGAFIDRMFAESGDNPRSTSDRLRSPFYPIVPGVQPRSAGDSRSLEYGLRDLPPALRDVLMAPTDERLRFTVMPPAAAQELARLGYRGMTSYSDSSVLSDADAGTTTHELTHVAAGRLGSPWDFEEAIARLIVPGDALGEFSKERLKEAAGVVRDLRGAVERAQKNNALSRSMRAIRGSPQMRPTDEPRFVPYDDLAPRFVPREDDQKPPAAAGKPSILDTLVGPGSLPAFVAKSLTNPEGLAEHAAGVALSAPLIAAGGTGAGALAARLGLKGGLSALAPIVGRVVTSGAESAGKAALKGDDPTTAGLTGAGVSAGTEGLLSLITGGRVPFLPKTITAGLKDLGERARGFEYARTAVTEALDDIAAKLPGIKFIIPALGNAKMTPEEVGRILSTSTGKTYEMGRRQLSDAITRAEKLYREMKSAATGILPERPLGYNAGQEFLRSTKPARFEPGVISRGAEGLRRGLDSTATRSGLDALAMEEAEGIPLGALAGAAILPAVTSRIPGTR